MTVVGEAGGREVAAGGGVGPEARGAGGEGRCLSYGEGITYFPVVEVIKQLDTRRGTSSRRAAAIAALLGESDAATTPDEIAWAFRKLLEQEAPPVVVFDDIHWGEETFLDLVEQVALLCDGAVLLLCLARPGAGRAPPRVAGRVAGWSRSPEQ